jgi:hypothetical protein
MTLDLNKQFGTAVLQRSNFFWSWKPAEGALSELTDVTVHTAVDRASGIEICNTMLVFRTGVAWAFPASDKRDAEANAQALRGFLGTEIPSAAF